MSKVITDMSMSLDGYVADPNDDIQRVFGWFGSGGVTVEHANPYFPPFQVTEASAGVLRGAFDTIGALVAGRRVFDLTQGWGGIHPMGVPVFVVTHKAPEDWAHPEAPFTFVTGGLASAIEQASAVAGDKNVVIATPNLAQQALKEGLLDEIRVNLIPVLLGDGIPFFTGVSADLDGPEVVEGEGVTHLAYQVRK